MQSSATEGNALIIFEVNPLHNIIHMASAVLLLGVGLSQDKSTHASKTRAHAA
ncbi:hypothetical protein SAMN04488693_104104 [Arthrobacter subterraneus]|uniref:DUF4383 domain-containing protein n=1 Tax=Arthrobacter subterraneus TaxID=335973 RepID=A0A1G8GFX9_9MICC|nr:MULTISPECIES: DUF4383 domain-containing protein [Arthrobacter]SDH93265.1 hypothetical protein SAMN04488693_104104 [Arthrobacter subterraneus]